MKCQKSRATRQNPGAARRSKWWSQSLKRQLTMGYNIIQYIYIWIHVLGIWMISNINIVIGHIYNIYIVFIYIYVDHVFFSVVFFRMKHGGSTLRSISNMLNGWIVGDLLWCENSGERKTRLPKLNGTHHNSAV